MHEHKLNIIDEHKVEIKDKDRWMDLQQHQDKEIRGGVLCNLCQPPPFNIIFYKNKKGSEKEKIGFHHISKKHKPEYQAMW